MKFSMFNIITKIDENKYILSNTMYGSMYTIDESVRQKIINSELSEFNKDDLVSYYNKGIIVEDDVDEYQRFVYYSDKSKFKGDTLSITLLLTNECNFRCTYCFQTRKNSLNYMDNNTQDKIYEFIKRSFNENKELRNLSIILFGGEPLIHINKYKNLLYKIKSFCYDNKYGYSTQIVTNGSLLNKNNIQLLSDNNCTNIQITVDGIKSVHNSTRMYMDGRGSFDDVIRGIKLVMEDGKMPSPLIRINISEKNYDDVLDLIEYFYSNKLSDCYIDFGIIFDSKNSCNNGELSEITLKGKMYRLWSILRHRKFVFNYMPVRKWLYCGAYSENYITIDVDGSMYKCWDIVKEEQFKLGNIKDFNNVSLDKYVEWIQRDKKLGSRCKKCKYLPVCGFGCANLSYQKTGSIFNGGCNSVKWIYDDQIKFMKDYSEVYYEKK